MLFWLASIIIGSWKMDTIGDIDLRSAKYAQSCRYYMTWMITPTMDWTDITNTATGHSSVVTRTPYLIMIRMILIIIVVIRTP